MSISDLFRNLFLLSVITVLSYGNAMDLPMQQQNANNNISNLTDVNFYKNDDKIKSTNINIINNEEANNNINYLFQSILDDLKTKNDNTTQVVLQKLEQVNSQLMNRTTMPTVEQGDLLQWVKHAREELQESEKSGYFHERTKYEKGLK